MSTRRLSMSDWSWFYQNADGEQVRARAAVLLPASHEGLQAGPVSVALLRTMLKSNDITFEVEQLPNPSFIDVDTRRAR